MSLSELWRKRDQRRRRRHWSCGIRRDCDLDLHGMGVRLDNGKYRQHVQNEVFLGLVDGIVECELGNVGAKRKDDQIESRARNVAKEGGHRKRKLSRRCPGKSAHGLGHAVHSHQRSNETLGHRCILRFKPRMPNAHRQRAAGFRCATGFVGRGKEFCRRFLLCL